MKAAYFQETGPATVIVMGEVPTPTPAAGQLLVRVTYAGLNPIDTYIRSGAVAMSTPKPFITGTDFAGVVEKVGEGVSGFQVGQRVWGSNQGLLGRQGTFAEYVSPSAEYVYPIPDGVSDEQACACALTGITAYLGLFTFRKIQPNELVFVNGGTGGVGSLVVQMAKAVGARIACTVGSESKAQLAQELGADRTILYKTEDVAEKIREFTHNQGLHLWYETLREPNYDRIVESMRMWGRIVIMAGRTARPVFPHGPFYVKGLTLMGFAMFNCSPEQQRQAALGINQFLENKKIRSPIGKIFSLREAAQAHQLQEENTVGGVGTLTGKILIKIGSE
jgi:NADPH2:quinone reductase